MKKLPAWLILCVITLVAGLALGMTNDITKDEIDRQTAAAAEAARKAVAPEADSFEALSLPEGASVDYCYEAKRGAEVIGYVVQATVKGYGGEVEVTVGLDPDGALTGVSCGGANFSETAGLGAKVKEAKFTSQFPGLSTPVDLVKNGGEVDAVTAASISSGAVCNAINIAADYVASIG